MDIIARKEALTVPKLRSDELIGMDGMKSQHMHEAQTSGSTRRVAMEGGSTNVPECTRAEEEGKVEQQAPFHQQQVRLYSQNMQVIQRGSSANRIQLLNGRQCSFDWSHQCT